jgi:ketosteroid isomerase-like protein
MTDKEIVLAFVKAINDHDVDKIYDLMPEDHIFIDGYGEKHVGKIDMKEGWQNYYQMFPDYSVDITDIVEDNLVIGLFGYASATYKINKDKTNSNFWKTPAAWKAIVENEKIKHWQVYCDYTRLMEIIKKHQKGLIAT